MMTDAPTGHFQSIVLQPHAGQFVIDELPAIVLCCAAWVYGGMEGLPLTALAVSVAALLSLALLYRFIYLRRTPVDERGSESHDRPATGVQQLSGLFPVDSLLCGADIRFLPRNIETDGQHG